MEKTERERVKKGWKSPKLLCYWFDLGFEVGTALTGAKGMGPGSSLCLFDFCSRGFEAQARVYKVFLLVAGVYQGRRESQWVDCLLVLLYDYRHHRTL